MLPANPLLFDPDDLRASPADRSLVIRSTPGRPLGKGERAFNRAFARVQALSRALDNEKLQLDRLLVFHAAEIRPRTDRACALRVGIEQLRRALERLSSNEALQEVRGAIREYRDSEKRQKSVEGWQR